MLKERRRDLSTVEQRIQLRDMVQNKKQREDRCRLQSKIFREARYGKLEQERFGKVD